MTNAEAWAVILGIILPFLVSLLKGCDWDRRAKFALAVALSIAVGAGDSYFAGNLVVSWEHALVDIAIVFGAAQVVYKTFLEDTVVDKALTNCGSSGGGK